MALIHDLGELYTGDISAASLHDLDLKYNNEKEAIGHLSLLLPNNLGSKLLEVWNEYGEGTTPEAVFVKALDKA